MDYSICIPEHNILIMIGKDGAISNHAGVLALRYKELEAVGGWRHTVKEKIPVTVKPLISENTNNACPSPT